MRLRGGTLILLLASIVIIAAVLVLNNQPAAAPDAAPTPTGETSGPIFPEIFDTTAQEVIVRFEATNNQTGEKTIMTKDDAGVWTVAEATNANDLATDQVKAVGTMSILASLTAVDRFTTDKLADFGLDAPTHTLTLTDKEGKTYTVRVGRQAPANPRYYALVNDDAQTVYVLPKDLIDNIVRQMIAVPPYVASPTPTATATRTPNPYSEVEMTATAAVEQTATSVALTQVAEATAEATGESTPEPAPPATPTATAAP